MRAVCALHQQALVQGMTKAAVPCAGMAAGPWKLLPRAPWQAGTAAGRTGFHPALRQIFQQDACK